MLRLVFSSLQRINSLLVGTASLHQVIKVESGKVFRCKFYPETCLGLWMLSHVHDIQRQL